MTFVRRKALEISSWVTWLAAPGCREWAEALECEVEFIESDWAALGWAIGSTRVLLEPREAPLGSLEEVPGVAHRFVDSVRGGQKMWPILMLGFMYLPGYFQARSGSQNFGLALIMFGAAIGVLSILVDRSQLKEPWTDDVYNHLGFCTLFYMAQLERQVRKLWILPVVWLCYFVGIYFATGSPSLTVRNPLIAGLAVLCCSLVLAVYLHLRRLYLRRIERLVALLGEAL